MMLATFESGGIAASRKRLRRRPSSIGVAGLDVELDDLHLALGEDVRLPRGRDAEDPRDRVRGLELRGDDEVDVELALAPGLEVLDLAGADDVRALASSAFGEHRRDEVRLVARACRRSAGRRP